MNTPLYLKVKRDIAAAIRSGRLKPGARTPSEADIVRRYAVSRMTANRALRELADEGLVRRVAGAGSFVAETPRRTSLIALKDIAEEIAERGGRHTIKILKRAQVMAGHELMERFELSSPVRLAHVVAVHLEDGTPVQFEDRHVNLAVAPEFMACDFSQVTPAACLIATVPADELEHTVEACVAGADMAEALAVEPGSPCLSLSRRSWHAGRVVTVARFVWPASRYQLYSRYAPGPLARQQEKNRHERDTLTA